MKTTLLVATALILGLSQNVMAGEKSKLYGYQMGYSSNSINDSSSDSSKTAGYYINLDFMGSNPSGFGWGIGIDINAMGNNTLATYGGTLKGGYTFQNQYNIPLKLKAGVGYGYLSSIVDNGWGLHYEAGAEFLIYKNIGLGAKIKHAQADTDISPFKNDSTIFFMTFGY
jgi:hypothetical protein